MDDCEAEELLRSHLESYRSRSRSDLVQMIGEPEVLQIQGKSGVTYQIEIEVFWDHKPGGMVRVLGSIDDGRWRAFKPLCRGFLMSSDGRITG